MKVDEIADVTSNTYKRPNLVTDDDVIEKHETMDSPYGKKKTVQHETDVLGPVHLIRPPSRPPSRPTLDPFTGYLRRMRTIFEFEYFKLC